MKAITGVFQYLMDLCYGCCKNYGAAILLFTLFSRVIMFPLAIWVQKQSIKMVKLMPKSNEIRTKYYGDKDKIAEEEHKLYKLEGYSPFASIIPVIIQFVILLGLIAVVREDIASGTYEQMFFGIDVGIIPSQENGWFLLSPLFAALSSWVLSFTQNRSNVLQAEQGKGMQIGMLLFAVLLSLYLGYFVPVGVALYWIAGNLLAVAQMYLLNYMINPQKYIDYEALEESRKALAKMQGATKKAKRTKEEKKLEKESCKRFYSIGNKHLVFYSESSGFYKYYRGFVEYILQHTNMTIHYVTSDPRDAVFEKSKNNDRLKSYYVGDRKLITFMMKLDADVCVMTMPDLENYHIKRSYVRKDVFYINASHGMGSNNLTFRTGALDHYDSLLCTGPHQKEEYIRQEELHEIRHRDLVEVGYPLLDDMRSAYKENEDKDNGFILVAPSWQDGNIIESCLDELIQVLKKTGKRVIVRPHPEQVKRMGSGIKALADKYNNMDGVSFQADFTSNETVFEADMLVTDWSDISGEYAYTTYKPVLFLDTPMKVMNPNYKELGIEPYNVWIRNEIGTVIKPDEIGSALPKLEDMLLNGSKYRERIKKCAEKNVYNLDNSAEVGARYIVKKVQEQIERRREKE